MEVERNHVLSLFNKLKLLMCTRVFRSSTESPKNDIVKFIIFSDQLVLFFILLVSFLIIKTYIMTKTCQLWSVSPCDTKHAHENGQNNESLYKEWKNYWKYK